MRSWLAYKRKREHLGHTDVAELSEIAVVQEQLTNSIGQPFNCSFDVSSNSLSGPLPSFFSSLPPWLDIFIQVRRFAIHFLNSRDKQRLSTSKPPEQEATKRFRDG